MTDLQSQILASSFFSLLHAPHASCCRCLLGCLLARTGQKWVSSGDQAVVTAPSFEVDPSEMCLAKGSPRPALTTFPQPPFNKAQVSKRDNELSRSNEELLASYGTPGTRQSSSSQEPNGGKSPVGLSLSLSTSLSHARVLSQHNHTVGPTGGGLLARRGRHRLRLLHALGHCLGT
jgi:hypothetical protein